MLIPAQLRQDELKKLFISTWYDEKFQFYWDGTGRAIYQSDDNCYYSRQFASIDKNNDILGYIGYSYNNDNRSANNFGLCAFTETNRVFFDDVILCVYEIFYKYHLNRVEFTAFEGNPAIKGYRAFLKRYGGKEAGRLRDTCRLMDGCLHDSYIFECLRYDLLLKDRFNTGLSNVETKLEFDALKIINKRKVEEIKK